MSTPAPTLARDFALAINTGTTEAPTWTSIGGITNITPSNDSTKTDDADFDSNGRARSSVVERSDSFQVDMNYKEDPDDGTVDPGQAALITCAAGFGADAKGSFKYTFPAGGTVEFSASVDMPWPGGGKTDNSTMTATLTIDGDVTYTEAS